MAKDKRTYTKKIEHSADISYENEFRFDNVHAPKHYLHGKKETIDVIQDLGRRGSLFITRPAIMHYVAKRNDLEWTANDLFNAISKGVVKSNVNYEFSLKDIC